MPRTAAPVSPVGLSVLTLKNINVTSPGPERVTFINAPLSLVELVIGRVSGSVMKCSVLFEPLSLLCVLDANST